MEDIVVKGNVLQKAIEEGLPELLKSKFTSTYDNPIKDIIDEEIKAQDGAIRTFIREILVSLFTDEKFKEKLTAEIVTVVIQKGLGR